MEGSESAMNRVGRVMWTVWGYLTGSVGRYLRPEVTNEVAHNVHFKRDDTAAVNTNYEKLEKNEGEKVRTETKTTDKKAKEDWQFAGVQLRTAAVQWEKGNSAHDDRDVTENSIKSMAGIDKKLQIEKDNEKMLDNKNGSKKAQSNKFTETEYSPACIDVVKNQEKTFFEGKEADITVKWHETNQEEKTEKKRMFAKTENESNESEYMDPGQLAKEAALNVKKSENKQERNVKQEEEEEYAKKIKKENIEPEGGQIKSKFTEKSLLSKEAGLNIERSDNQEEQRMTFEEESFNETGDELIKNKFIEQGLLTKEAVIHVERSENYQEQGRQEKEKGVDEISENEFSVTEEKTIKSESMDQDSFMKESKLNVGRSGNSHEQRRKQQEEGVVEIKAEGNEEPEEELIIIKLIEQDLLAKEADLNVERNENYQEQSRKQEEENIDQTMNMENYETEKELSKISELNVMRAESRQDQDDGEVVGQIKRRENDKAEERITIKVTEQELLCKKAALNVQSAENYLDQTKKQEEEEKDVDEISLRDYDEFEDQPIKIESIDRCLLVKEADLKVESDNRQEQTKQEQEGGIEIKTKQNDEPGEEPIQSMFTEQGLLVKEAAGTAERNENYQEQARQQEMEEKGIDKISMREFDETEDQPVKTESTDQGLFMKEADLNGKMSKNIQAQKQNQEKEEEGVEVIMVKNYELGEEVRQNKLIEQASLAKEAALDVKRNENKPEQSKKEEEGHVNELLRKEYYEIEEEPIKSNFTGQSLEPEKQASVCDIGDIEVDQGVLMEVEMKYVSDPNKNELSGVDQSIQGMTEPEIYASKSTVLDEGLHIQLASTWEGREPLNDVFKLEVEMTKNATLLPDKDTIDIDNGETKQETREKEKDEYYKEFTSTEIIEQQVVCGMEMEETEGIDRNVEDECKLLEMDQMENEEMCKKESCMVFENEDNNLTMSVQKLEQSKEQKAASEVALNADIRQLNDTAHDHMGLQQLVVVPMQDVKGVIVQPETGTGNQIETAETTSNFRTEVASVEVKKSAERETNSHKQPTDKKEATLQEITGQCLHEQGSLLEESADTKINGLSALEVPFSERNSVPVEQVAESAVDSFDEIQSSSLQKLDKCSSDANFITEVRAGSPNQNAEVKGMHKGGLKCEQAQLECEISYAIVQNICDQSVPDETSLDSQINQDDCTASSNRFQIGRTEALYLPEKELELETIEIQRDSHKDSDEQERTHKSETGLLDEINNVMFCHEVVEETNGFLNKSQDSENELLRQTEASERKEYTGESCDVMSESNMNMELQIDVLKCDKEFGAEITNIESMLVSISGEMDSVKKMEESITGEVFDKCDVPLSKSEASKEIVRKHAEKIKHDKSALDAEEDMKEKNRPGLHREFEKTSGNIDMDKPSVLADISLQSQDSSLDFTVQKSKIAVKNPLVRPPKYPRMLINMASVEPLTPPHPSQCSFLKRSPIEGTSVSSKCVTGFKLPGLGTGFPALRKTEAGRQIRDVDDSDSVTSQKSGTDSQATDDDAKQETLPCKPKWTPPRQPGMGSLLMMSELKSKLKKPAE